MAWADEIGLMHEDVAGTFARVISVQYATSIAENPYTGVDSSFGATTANVRGVCHEALHSFAATGGGGARAGRETRVIGFLLADLNAAGVPASGVPERGRLRVNDPTGGTGDWWTLDAVEFSGELRQWVNCTFILPSGPRKAS